MNVMINQLVDLSADASVYKIMLEYLQPFELASLTGAHSPTTYINAAAHGSTEYIKKHPEFWWYNDVAWCQAAANGQLECVKLLYEYGACGIGAVIAHAAGNGHIRVVEFLIKIPKATPYIGRALISAASGGHTDMIHLLVKTNPNLTFNSALVQAAFGGHLAAIRLLIELGANNFAEASVHALINNQTIASTILDELAKN